MTPTHAYSARTLMVFSSAVAHGGRMNHNEILPRSQPIGESRGGRADHGGRGIEPRRTGFGCP